MRDFSIESLRQETIFQLQEEQYDKEAAEQVGIDMAITVKNKQIMDGLLQFATQKSIRELSKERVIEKSVVLPEEALEMAIKNASDIKMQLRTVRLDSVNIEEEVNAHVDFVKMNGYEKMAEIKI